MEKTCTPVQQNVNKQIDKEIDFQLNHYQESNLVQTYSTQQNGSTNSLSSAGLESARRHTEVDSESGVEPDYNDWIFEDSVDQEALMDLTTEQALATLKYFTSTADRANMMTKTHSDDLEIISQLLNEKEKDLELAARIGQSLLQRNKQLLVKIEQMEDYLSETKDHENQLKYDLQHKNELVKQYMQYDDENRSLSSNDSKEEVCDDEELTKLTRRCRMLERENQELFSEALSLRQVTEEVEEKEEGLVLDCIEQLASAKEQITQLTDEIAQKFEDNVQQQEEITQLISLVVDLQKKQKQLNSENEVLQTQLVLAQENQESLQEQLAEMQKKFRETYEMLQENQEEMKTLKARMDYGANTPTWSVDSAAGSVIHDSLANEIEETVRRDLLSTHDNRRRTKKTLDSVRYLNTRVAGDAYSRSTSGRTSPVSMWSLASDERSETGSVVSVDTESTSVRSKKGAKKLQIVKPLEGSDTLNKWQHLASQNVTSGLNISAEEKSPDSKNMNSTFDDDTKTVTSLHEHPTAINLPDPIYENSTTDDEQIETQSRKLLKTSKQSTPNEKKPPLSMFSNLDNTAVKRRTIITRNTSVLNSLRQSRKLLSENDKQGKSQTEVIDMIANAMSKVNVEAKTGQRILESLNKNKKAKGIMAASLPKSDFKGMPHVAKVLEKVGQSQENSPSHQSVGSKESDETYKSNKSNISSSENINSSKTKHKENEAFTEETHKKLNLAKTLSLEIDSSDTEDNELNAVGGPLGLLNRANPSDNNSEIMSRLLRLSSRTAVPEKSSNQETNLPLRRNQSGGSLVEMMMLNKRLPRVQMGVANLVSPSDGAKASFDDSINRSTLESKYAENKTGAKSVESGLDRPTNDNAAGQKSLYGGFLSFLGKFS